MTLILDCLLYKELFPTCLVNKAIVFERACDVSHFNSILCLITSL